MLRSKIFRTVFCVLFAFSCIKAKDEVNEVQSDFQVKDSNNVNPKDIEALEYIEYALSDLGQEAVTGWIEFQQLVDRIELVKQNDLSFLDDMALLTSFIKDLKNGIPEEIDLPSISVRLTVLETSALKLESINNLANVSKELKLEYIKQLLISYSNLIYQINKELEKASQIIEEQF